MPTGVTPQSPSQSRNTYNAFVVVANVGTSLASVEPPTVWHSHARLHRTCIESGAPLHHSVHRWLLPPTTQV
jgi:hypothetical protein